jgi:hypothetical protein
MAAGSPEQRVDEYQVKAAFIYNFIKFVQWPAEAFHSSKEPFSICILGPDPFGRSLEDTVANHEIGGRTFSIRHISDVKQGAACHVLFVGPVGDIHLPPAIAELASPGVLTIGDSNVSGADGVIIRFRLDAGKVRFEIDAGAAERKGLRISSRLLSLAFVPESGRRRF